MADVASILEGVKDFGETWGATSALAVALVYLAGYLSLRFHYTALGLGVGLHLFDHRYLFAGGRFLIFLQIHLVRLILFAVLAIAFVEAVKVLIPLGTMAIDLPWLVALWHPARPIVAFAVTIAVLLFVFAYAAQVLQLNHLLLRDIATVQNLARQNPALAQCARVLKGDAGAGIVHFSLLLLATTLSAMAAGWVLAPGDLSAVDPALGLALVVATATQILLLPVHHGMLYADKAVPVLEAAADGTRCCLLYRGSQHAALLTTARDGVFRIQQVPIDDLNGLAEIGFAHLGRLILRESTP